MTAITRSAPQRPQENALVTATGAALDGSVDLHILDRTDGSWDTRTMYYDERRD
jgi:hypothetical protein